MRLEILMTFFVTRGDDVGKVVDQASQGAALDQGGQVTFPIG
jgi:hypothetical protein